MSTNKCPQCGATLFGQMVSLCYKCGSSVDFHSEIDKQREAAAIETRRQKALDPVLKKKYSILYQAIQADMACLYYSVSPMVAFSPVSIIRSNDAWEVFVADILYHGCFTCFWCCSCNFLHVANYGNGKEITTATFQRDHKSFTVYYLRRADGSCSPNNWAIDFSCLGCGLANRDVPTTVSYDGYVDKKGDPFIRPPEQRGFRRILPGIVRWMKK